MLVDEVFGQDVMTEEKGDDGLDLVTTIDRNMQARLTIELERILSGSVALGEEEFANYAGAAPVWLVDPLDGTVNFVAGLPAFSVSVALLRDGQPVLSAVYDVPNNTMYSAIKGTGSWCDGALIRPKKHGARLAIVSSGLLANLTNEAPETLSSLLNSFKLRNFGSQALHLCYVAMGSVRLVASREAKGWDDIAGALIAQEAGMKYGHYKDYSTKPAFDENQHSICTHPEAFEQFRAVFACSLPDTLPNLRSDR
ncbi:hypothetical protein J7400_01275 [Shimia sp. R9_2]|uniref:inositol monophosphatase family protein n=1 Tax=Shimia sp. R9_2 TaxID=2821112 RepID=UPI001ADD3C9F|nr:inositol monophosphatase family protein [Shimia sp. R9_2]MBO9395292.1 hypothetical protein [Shimia sp. R9_2]